MDSGTGHALEELGSAPKTVASSAITSALMVKLFVLVEACQKLAPILEREYAIKELSLWYAALNDVQQEIDK
jgi:hypothetical protein